MSGSLLCRIGLHRQRPKFEPHGPEDIWTTLRWRCTRCGKRRWGAT